MSEVWPWLALAGLGAYHGINPGMGWLFAVALGLQQQRHGAVLGALAPIALGHAVSVGVVVLAVALLQDHVPHQAIRWGGAAVLIGFGLLRLIRSRHPRWGGMQVNWRDLTIWSFLMASAHGAGLMLVPVLLGMPTSDPPARSEIRQPAQGDPHAHHRDPVVRGVVEHEHKHEAGGHAGHGAALEQAAGGRIGIGLLAVLVHTLAYLVVMAVVALLVYEKLGLALLRRSWWNLDLLWAIALIVTGVLTLAV